MKSCVITLVYVHVDEVVAVNVVKCLFIRWIMFFAESSHYSKG